MAVCKDRFGTVLESGDEITVEIKFAAFSKCKKESGWVVLEFHEHESVTETIAVYTDGEIASFPLHSVTKKQDIKKFMNYIAPSRSTKHG